MTCKREEMDDRISLFIQGALSIYEVIAVREEIMACFKEDAVIQIDLSHVTECDTAGVQLLLAARKTADQQNRALAITGLSQAVTAILEGAGLRSDEITG